MYNTCNVNYTQNGCYNTANTTEGCLGYGQRICRDCCGNIWVRRNTCGCTPRCLYQNATPIPENTCCGTNGGNGCTNGGNGGQFGCFTVCGRVFNNPVTQQTGTTTNFDLYYARQYGLYPYGGTTGCCGGNSFAND